MEETTEESNKEETKFEKLRRAFKKLYEHHDEMKAARKRAYEERFPNNELSRFFKEEE